MPRARGEYLPRRLAGRCADGNEGGGGRKYHAVRVDSGKALCGSAPGRLSAGWSDPGEAVTCPTCLMKLAKATPRRTPTQQSWDQMKARCSNPKHHAWRHYGGRGIAICDRWLESFDNFLADMGERPEGTSLDRIDPNGHYAPENCRWATSIQQQANRRNRKEVEAFGRQQTVAEWAREYSIPVDLVHGRLKRGWSLEDALTKAPVRTGGDHGVNGGWTHGPR